MDNHTPHSYLEDRETTTFTQISCQWEPATVTPDAGVPMGGTGKYKDAPKVVTSVAQTTTKLSANSVVANPTNALQYTPLTWATELTVNYANKGFLHWSML